MANTTENSKFSFNHFTGSLLIDGAPYSALGMHELKILSPIYAKIGMVNWIHSILQLGTAIIGNMALALTQVILGEC